MNIVEETIKLGDKSIFFKRWIVPASHKTPIILLHESLGSVELWKSFPQRLAEFLQREVIAYDRLGFGKSSPLEKLSLNFITEEAQTTFAAVLQHLEIDQFIVMGHSVGGGMTAVIAAIYPDRCKAAITISAQSMVEEITRQGIKDAETNFCNEQFIKKLAKFHGDKAEWVLRAWIDTWLSPSFRNWNIDAYISKIECPLLVIHGEHDEYATLSQPERLIQLANGYKELKILKDCGHFPHKEKETEVITTIQSFLEKI